MKKQDPIFVACLAGGLVCGAALQALAQNTIRQDASDKQTADFSAVPVSRVGEAGKLASEQRPSAIAHSLLAKPEKSSFTNLKAIQKIQHAAISTGGGVKSTLIPQQRSSAARLNPDTTDVTVSKMADVGKTRAASPSVANHALSRASESKNHINQKLFEQSRLVK